MKKLSPLVLVVSLLLNLALAWLIFGHHRLPATAGAAATAVPPPIRPPALDAGVWPGLQTANLPELIARLRAAGFPEHLVRAIAAAQLDENFAARRRVLDAGTENLPFWKTRTPDPRINLASLQLEREKQAALRQLLGPEPEFDDPVGEIARNRRLQGLPPDKVEAVGSLLREYEKRWGDIVATSSSIIQGERLAALEKAQRDALVRLLTPQELEEYDLRASNTAAAMRYELTAFNPTEAEFRAIFRLRQPFDAESALGGRTPTPEQVKAVLPPDRAADYERAVDYSFRQTSQLVARLELPPETSGQVYAVQKDIRQRLSGLYDDQSLSPDQRTQQLAPLRQEAEARLTSLLGAQGLEAYRQYGGIWMQSLTPPAPR
jgi:hypothetical protein